MTPIKWIEKQVKIQDLKDYEHNPRKMSKKDFERLVRDIKDDGYHKRLLVNTDNIIIGGHSRKKALLAAGYKPSDKLDVLIPNRTLTEDELKRINVKDNLGFGEFDFDILANVFDATDLLEWGMPALSLPVLVDPAAEVEEKDDNKLKCELCGK